MNPDSHDDAAAVRLAAESRLIQKITTRPPLDAKDLRRLRHELELHQMQFEIQNEERPLARAETETGHGRYTELFEFAPVGYFSLTQDGVIQLANLTTASLLGVERQQLSGLNFTAIVIAADRDAFRIFLALVLATDAGQTCELSLITRDGSPLIVRVEAARSGNGNECRLVLINVTDRRIAEKQLVASERRLRAVFDAEPQCVKLLDREGRLIDMNPAGLRMIEADSFQQVRNQYVDLWVYGGHRKAFLALTDRVFRGESGVLEFQIIGQKGGRCWVESHATPLRNATGEITALLAVTRDLTERKQAAAMADCRTTALHSVAIGRAVNRYADDAD